jgi:hypothetical protein
MEIKIIETILAYFAFVFGVLIYTKIKYVNPFSEYAFPNIKYSSIEIVIFSVSLSLYNVFCTHLSDHFNAWDKGDRANYLYSFLNDRSNSTGLDFLFNVAHLFDLEFVHFLYITTFLCAALTFWGLRQYKNLSLLSLFFFFSTDYFFMTFSQLKQCYTNAFSVLFFSVLFSEKNALRDVACLCLALLASLFHVTGYILFPIFIAFRIIESNSKNFRKVLFCFVFIISMFKPVLLFITNATSNILPYLSTKIALYFFDDAINMNDGSYMTFVKGCPFYFVTVIGLLRRRYLSKIIPFYDNYLLISIAASFLYALSIYSYWMFRFTSLFYLPVGVFFCLILRFERNLLDRFFTIFFIFVPTLVVRIRHIILSYINFGGID